MNEGFACYRWYCAVLFMVARSPSLNKGSLSQRKVLSSLSTMTRWLLQPVLHLVKIKTTSILAHTFGLDLNHQSWKARKPILALTWLVGENLSWKEYYSFVYNCCTCTWVCKHCDCVCYPRLLGDRFALSHAETNDLFVIKWWFLAYPKKLC